MKRENAKPLLLSCAVILCFLLLCGCSPLETTASIQQAISQTTSPFETYRLVIGPPKALSAPLTSLDEPFQAADWVVRCTVTEIGDAYLRDGVSISADDSDIEIGQKMMGIRTPVTITVNEVFKGDIAVGDTLTLTEQYGSYSDYYLAPLDAPLEENGEYILFIAYSGLFDQTGLMGQCTIRLTPATDASVQSVEAAGADFISVAGEDFFDNYADAEAIMSAIRALPKT